MINLQMLGLIGPDLLRSQIQSTKLHVQSYVLHVLLVYVLQAIY